MRMFFVITFIWIGNLLAASDPTYSFSEIWAYVMKGEEKYLTKNSPATDIAYFSAQISEIGRLERIPDRKDLPKSLNENKRVHLVVFAPGNRSLMYWCLGRDLLTREALLQDILQASIPFDGVQIDFEVLRNEDKELYWAFLHQLRKKLPKEKIFSVAVPARWSEKKDPFNYAKIASIADKVVVMAYDEHWRTGTPGTIASLNWCEKIRTFAQKQIPSEKLIMGIPLYGRIWQKQEVAKALKYFELLDLWKKNPVSIKKHPDGSGQFEFQQTVDAVVYFENLESLQSKLSHYQLAGIRGVGFWRISQEPTALWDCLSTQQN